MRGLSSNIRLQDGRFFLDDGSIKARDSVLFYCTFDKYREYASDYGARFVTLEQKPASYIQANRTILLNVLAKGFKKYVENVTIRDIDMGYIGSNRQQLRLRLEYSAMSSSNQVENGVIFV